MIGKLTCTVISGVVYTKKEDGTEKVFSRYDRENKMEVVNVFSPSSDSKDRIKAFKTDITSLLISSRE